MASASEAKVGSTVTKASACRLVIAKYSASRRLSQSCSRAMFQAVLRETRSPSKRILVSVIRSCAFNASRSLRFPLRTSRSNNCSASLLIEFGATS